MSDEELRYGFGQNWGEFIEKHLSEQIVTDSIEHMKKFMRRDNLNGLRILDIGCGSGIHSLAMKKLGAAEVVAFDYDVNSVETSKKVREWSGLKDGWSIEQGSVLDADYVKSLGKFDIVYSWGVLHHTGAMWDAIRNAGIPLKENGEFYIALYSSEIYVNPSPQEWVKIKKEYNYANSVKKKIMELKHLWHHVLVPEMKSGKSIVEAISSYGGRGMDIWTDIKDWLGGYPMEFAGLAETRDFCEGNFNLEMVNVLYGEGCTEYYFAPKQSKGLWAQIEKERVKMPMEMPFQNVGGNGFQIHLPEHAVTADDNGANKRSKLMIYEDDKVLGLPHSIHEEIRNRGLGRFSHWQEWLVFSSSDNSDPNVNGRKYTFTLDY